MEVHRGRGLTDPLVIGILPLQLSAKFPAIMTVFPPPVHVIGTLTAPSFSGSGPAYSGGATDGAVLLEGLGAMSRGVALPGVWGLAGEKGDCNTDDP